MSDEGFRVPAWHAQHPGRSERYPLCGTVNLNGRATHRVSLTLPITCQRCKRILAAKELRPNVGVEPPYSVGSND